MNLYENTNLYEIKTINKKIMKLRDLIFVNIKNKIYQ